MKLWAGMCKKIKDKKKNPVQRSSKNNDSFKTATIAETVELETDKKLNAESDQKG